MYLWLESKKMGDRARNERAKDVEVLFGSDKDG